MNKLKTLFYSIYFREYYQSKMKLREGRDWEKNVMFLTRLRLQHRGQRGGFIDTPHKVILEAWSGP